MNAGIDVWTLIERYQTLIAGVLAIAAAWIAYRGELRQAAAVLDAEKQRLLEQRRAVAGALWAELCNVGTRLFADSQRLIATPVRDGRMLDLTPIDLSVFHANVSALGTLPPDDASMVTQVYKIVQDINLRYEKVSASAGIDHQWASGTGQWLATIVGQVRTTLEGLRETAGMPEDKAKAAMTPWTPVTRSAR